MTTCIAIALFGDEVSPRFCYAESALVVSVGSGHELWRRVVSLGDPWIPSRVSQLAAMGVRTILCGAFHRAYLPSATYLGIRVVTGISGKAEEALALFRQGQMVAVSSGRRCRRGDS